MKLHFRKYGEGLPFVILHGLFGMSDNWQSIGKKLSERYTVYLVDLRNHGHSPHSNEWDYNSMSEDIKELFDDEGITSAILMGHSMGGKTAMTFAGNYCSRLEKMIVVDIALRRYDPPSDVLNALKAVHLDSITSRKEAEQVISFYIDDPGTSQFILKNLYWADDNRLAWRFNLDAIAPQIENVAGSVDVKDGCKVPTRFIRGEKSSYIRDNDIADLQKYFPRSKVITVPGAGHWVHAENPAGFMEALETFL